MSRPIGPQKHHDRLHARRFLAMLTVACALILSSCGTESSDVPDDRKFANDPVTAETVTATLEVNVDATPVVIATPVPASPETLLQSRGTPNTLYTLANDTLLAITVRDSESESTEIRIPAGQHVLDFDGSPRGDRVAVLMGSDDGEPVSLGFFQANGEPLGEVREIPGEEPAATPASADTAMYSVTWSPQGTGVLVSGPTMLASVTLEGDPQPISLGDFEGRLIDAGWSPQGSRMFLHFAVEDGSHQVFVRDLATEKTRDARPLSSGPGTGVTDIHWLPDGSGMTYVQGPLVDGVVMRGQLFAYALGQEGPALIATSGQGGPSATITDAVVSPDGRSVAYVISILDGTEWSFHSMWIRSLNANLGYQVPVTPRGIVSRLAWVDRGLVWDQRMTEDAPGDILHIRQGQMPVVVFDAPSVAPAGTPGASPVVDPGATPVASPGATPVSTPGA